MLGDFIGEGKGRITGVRVLPGEGQSPKMEVSFQAAGKLFGVDESEIGTYWSVMTPAGVLYGEGNGLITTAEGDVLTWIGQGIGRPTGRGLAASWRGAVYYRTSSAKFARLNSVAAVFEFEADEAGNTQAKLWEWK
jgi:hypothetical protein